LNLDYTTRGHQNLARLGVPLMNVLKAEHDDVQMKLLTIINKLLAKKCRLMFAIVIEVGYFKSLAQQNLEAANCNGGLKLQSYHILSLILLVRMR
jgi:hypothetical protein